MTPDFYVFYKDGKEYGRYDSLNYACRRLKLSNGCVVKVINGSAAHHKGFTARQGFKDPELDGFAHFLYDNFKLTLNDLKNMYGKRAIKEHQKDYKQLDEIIEITDDTVPFHMTDEDAIEIYKLYEAGYSIERLSSKFQKSDKSIRNVLLGKSHKEAYKEYFGDGHSTYYIRRKGENQDD